MTTIYNNTYYIFHDIYNNEYYKYDYKDLKINFNKEDLKFYIVKGDINSIGESKNIIDIMNKFFNGKKYIYYSYDDDNNLYIIYNKSKSLLTIREIIKRSENTENTEDILYIIDFENKEDNFDNLKKLLEKYINNEKVDDIKDVNEIYKIFDIKIDDL